MSIQKIYVVGGGFMGSGIAQNAIVKGFDVTMYDVSNENLLQGESMIHKNLSKSVEKNKLEQKDADDAKNRLSLSQNLEDAAKADLVIEAIFEYVEAKKKVFSALSDICDLNTIIATNTSSISISELGSVVKKPERFIGMHFFSPVMLMKLLEIVKGIATSKETVEVAKMVGEKMGKICVVSKDSPGFIVNRMLDPMINEAIGLVEAGIGSIEDIDTAMKYGLNHPMGPLELIDMAGIDIELAVMEVLYNETGDPKYRPALLLRNMVRLGWLGRKTGIGFYIYNDDGTRTPNPSLC